jgi:hypothetical protein
MFFRADPILEIAGRVVLGAPVKSDILFVPSKPTPTLGGTFSKNHATDNTNFAQGIRTSQNTCLWKTEQENDSQSKKSSSKIQKPALPKPCLGGKHHRVLFLFHYA